MGTRRLVFICSYTLMWGVLTLAPVLAQRPADGQKDLAVVPELVQRFDAGRKWAVVIGVNRYLDPTIPSLEYCAADARRVVDTLTKRCGYEEERILLIIDDQSEPHLRPLRINLLMQIPDWLRNARDGDTVLVFFSGHGFLDERGQGFLAPQDCIKENFGLSSFRINELRDMLMQCKAAQKVLVLDCCHAGAVKSGNRTGVSGGELGAAFREARGLITLASCLEKEQSREWREQRQGLFTYFFTKGLEGEGDYDHNGIVDSDELYRYLVDKVPTTAQRVLNARQTPVRFIPPDVVGVFALAKTERGMPAEATGNESIDLLAAINPDSDALEGTWMRDAAGLVSPSSGFAQLRVGVSSSKTYRLEIEATRVRGHGPLVIGLPVTASLCTAVLHGSTESVATLSLVDGKPVEDGAAGGPITGLTKGEKTTIICSVTDGRVTVQCDGRTVINWQGASSRLSCPNEWAVQGPPVLFVGTTMSAFRLTKIQLTTLGK